MSLNGALVVNKPQGITSARVVFQVKKLCKGVRVGHAGTLDPMATGVLIVLLGKATKLQDILLGSEKEYSGEIRLGIQTSTDDISGEVLAEDEKLTSKIFDEKFPDYEAELVKAFSGEIVQRPPTVSAVHLDGRRAYALAREGKISLDDMPERTVTIKELTLNFLSKNTISYSVVCSKGTYVRSLARDIGSHLGTVACLASIERRCSGSFSLSQAVEVDSLSEDTLEEKLLPMSELVKGLSSLRFNSDAVKLLMSGIQHPLAGVNLENMTGLVSLHQENHANPFGLAEFSDSKLRLRCIF